MQDQWYTGDPWRWSGSSAVVYLQRRGWGALLDETPEEQTRTNYSRDIEGGTEKALHKASLEWEALWFLHMCCSRDVLAALLIFHRNPSSDQRARNVSVSDNLEFCDVLLSTWWELWMVCIRDVKSFSTAALFLKRSIFNLKLKGFFPVSATSSWEIMFEMLLTSESMVDRIRRSNGTSLTSAIGFVVVGLVGTEKTESSRNPPVTTTAPTVVKWYANMPINIRSRWLACTPGVMRALLRRELTQSPQDWPIVVTVFLEMILLWSHSVLGIRANRWGGVVLFTTFSWCAKESRWVSQSCKRDMTCPST